MKKKQTRASTSKPKNTSPSPQGLARRLRKEIKELKAERDQYKKSLLAIIFPPSPINEKELLANTVKQPTLRELISELRATGD
jgi:hypothetical protein